MFTDGRCPASRAKAAPLERALAGSRRFDRGRGGLWGGSQSDVRRAFDPALKILGVLGREAAAVFGQLRAQLGRS